MTTDKLFTAEDLKKAYQEGWNKCGEEWYQNEGYGPKNPSFTYEGKYSDYDVDPSTKYVTELSETKS